LVSRIYHNQVETHIFHLGGYETFVFILFTHTASQ